MTQPPHNPSEEHCEHLSDAERLKQDYQLRLAKERPISHSVAVAYRQLIARCEQQQSDKHH